MSLESAAHTYWTMAQLYHNMPDEESRFRYLDDCVIPYRDECTDQAQRRCLDRFIARELPRYSHIQAS